MALDFENAFNTVEHRFIYDTLKSFNFGPEFIKWIQVLHKDTELAVINNGFTSDWFTPTRGLQQGCPASSLIFCLVVEILAVKIRAMSGIKGIKISGQEMKISQYIDDTTLFISDEDSANTALSVIQEFGTFSGLKLNLNKSQFMWLGACKTFRQPICHRPCSEQVKTLGIHFSASQKCDNVGPAISKMDITLKEWMQRHLTHKGRITAVNSLVISKFIYPMAATSICETTLNEIQSKIMKFIWRGRPPKVSRDTLYQNVEDGGLNAPNIICIYKAMRTAWFGKLTCNVDAAWSKILQTRLIVHFDHILHLNYDQSWINSRHVPLFYKEMFKWLREAIPLAEPSSGKEIRKQIIWYNSAIRVEGRGFFSRALYRRSINLLDDFLDRRGNVLSINNFKQKHSLRYLNPLKYISWCRAIPKVWKIKLSGSEPLSCEDKDIVPQVEIKNKLIPIQNVKAKYFRSSWLKEVTPTAQNKWIEEGIDFDERWKQIYALPFTVTKSTKLQSLQYRVLHRFFPTRRFLCIRKVTDDPFCPDCGEIDTIQHFFVECEEIKTFWAELIERLNQKVPRQQHVHIDSKTILFGSLKVTDAVNFIILNGKQYIAIKKFREETVTSNQFIPYLEQQFNFELVNAMKSKTIGKFKERWKLFLTEELQLNV